MNSTFRNLLRPGLGLLLLTAGAFAAGLPADVVSVNSVWKSDTPHSLTIRERQGEKFSGIFTFPAGNVKVTAEVAGDVKGNKISWLAKDARAAGGNPGGDNFGTITGDRIEFTWRRKDNGMSGKFALTRVPDENPPAAALPNASVRPAQSLEEAILNFPWEWTHAPKPPDLLIFGKDGVASCPRFSWHWKITGPRTVLAFDAIDGGKPVPNFQATLTFDETFSTLTAGTPNGKNRYTGRRLSASGPALASSNTPPASIEPAPAAIETSPDRPRIEVLKEQAPNVIEWALAPLDRAVPGDIRQNLTFLREDLLDESKTPQVAAQAYKLGTQLCNALLAVLEERNQTQAQSGFRAVEANARTGVTSQALEARRNSMMSWPQYAREESQRAELKSQAINNAAVMAERPKLEWAQRTSSYRKSLDTLYTQYREALRSVAK